jgi:hypothetical protein
MKTLLSVKIPESQKGEFPDLRLRPRQRLREGLSDQAASKKHDEYCSRFLFVHLRFSFHILISAQITEDQRFLEPVMCIRFGIKCLDFDISRASIEMDRLSQGSVGLQTKDLDTCFASVPF